MNRSPKGMAGAIPARHPSKGVSILMTYYLISAPASGNTVVIASLLPEKATIYLGVEGDDAQDAITNLFPLQLFSKGIHVRSALIRPNTNWNVTKESATNRAKCVYFLNKAKRENPASMVLWSAHEYLNMAYEWPTDTQYSDAFIADVMTRIWTEGPTCPVRFAEAVKSYYDCVRCKFEVTQ